MSVCPHARRVALQLQKSLNYWIASPIRRIYISLWQAGLSEIFIYGRLLCIKKNLLRGLLRR